MGLLDTVMGALGLSRPIRPREPAPLSLSRMGRARLERLAPGHELVVRAVPVDGGYLAAVDEEPPDRTTMVELQEGLWAEPSHAERLVGLILDYQRGGWVVRLELQVGARETPNPDGRLYEVDRVLHQGRPAFFQRSDGAPPKLVRDLFASEAVRSVLVREHTLTIEREPSHPWSAIDRHVDAALRAHILRGAPVLDGDRAAQREDPLEAEVARVLEEEVLPGVHRDGGDIVLLRVHDGVAYVSLRGACASCPASVLTLKGAVERTLKRAFPKDIDKVLAE
ncbi:MAG: hypothetical protein EA397_00275 [Deltaproteobacteria bacterium]|nr:MAG: hypothetical protein EA397_00275 [Deltaproteobacteria bacterium]